MCNWDERQHTELAQYLALPRTQPVTLEQIVAQDVGLDVVQGLSEDAE